MKTKNSVLILLSLLLVFACERDIAESNEEAEVIDENSEYVESEIDESWDSLGVTSLVLSGSDVSITGSGALFESQQIVISEAGEYYLTGSLDAAQLVVSAGDDDTVKLILDNVTLHSNDNACIYAETAECVYIVLNDGSVNTLSDNSSYSSEEQNALIFSKTDLVISGEGQLTVQANYKDGIASKDGLVIASGVFDIDAADDGIRGKDYLVIKDGTFSINSGGDAIKSDNEEEGYGNISILKGSYSIVSDADGIAAQSDLYITDGTFDITTTASAYDVSAKALKAEGLLYIESGTFILDSDDDAIHSNNDMTIVGGDFTISTADDAIHADNELEMENPTISISSSIEGIEAGYITVDGGSYVVYATDDGFNATQGSEVMSNDGSQLIVNDGTITVNMSGNDVDAMDSNGNITINGGTLNLNLPTEGVAEALDANGTITIASDATVYENGEVYTASSSSGGNRPGGH